VKSSAPIWKVALAVVAFGGLCATVYAPSRGTAWLGAREKVRVNVIGYIPEHIAPGTATHMAIAVGSLRFGASTEARAVIHLREL